jgi:hypothetical protein
MGAGLENREAHRASVVNVRQRYSDLVSVDSFGKAKIWRKVTMGKGEKEKLMEEYGVDS